MAYLYTEKEGRSMSDNTKEISQYQTIISNNRKKIKELEEKLRQIKIAKEKLNKLINMIEDTKHAANTKVQQLPSKVGANIKMGLFEEMVNCSGQKQYHTAISDLNNKMGIADKEKKDIEAKMEELTREINASNSAIRRLNTEVEG